MKHPIIKTLLALGCAGTFATAASAQLPTTYSPGDFVLGFREVGATESVVVDIGPIVSFSSPLVFSISAGATLSAQYGAGWASNTNVYFSLAETDSSDRTSFVTSPEYSIGPDAGTAATVWPRMTNTNAIKLQNEINSLGNEFTRAGETQPMTDPNAYANFMPGGSNDSGHANGNLSFGYFNPDDEGNLSQTTAGVALDLIQLVPGTPGTPGNDLGTFQLSSDGNTLSYTPDIVPEPSTYPAMAALGALALLGLKMNKTRKLFTEEQSA